VIERHDLGGFAGGSPGRLLALARELWATRREQEALADRCRRYIATEHSPDAVSARWQEVLGLPATVGWPNSLETVRTG
jgi:hypothetical protein